MGSSLQGGGGGAGEKNVWDRGGTTTFSYACDLKKIPHAPPSSLILTIMFVVIDV